METAIRTEKIENEKRSMQVERGALQHKMPGVREAIKCLIIKMILNINTTPVGVLMHPFMAYERPVFKAGPHIKGSPLSKLSV